MQCETITKLWELVKSESLDNLTITTLMDVLEQAKRLEENETLDSDFPGKVVAYCDNRLFYGDTFEETRRKIREQITGRPYYASKIPPRATPPPNNSSY